MTRIRNLLPDALLGLALLAVGLAGTAPAARNIGLDQTRQSRLDEARRQADAERLRVAQEVHDVVGHGLAAITMQAEIAQHVLARQPGQAEAALTAISRTSRESLDELRATLGTVSRAMVKLAARDRSQLVMFAYRSGLVD